jgi:hypothetical protein
MEDIKIVYAFNLLTKEYKGPKVLDKTDKSPISGAWQIPCNMVEVIPPVIPVEHKCFWDGSQWILKKVEKEKEPARPNVTQIKKDTTQTPSLSERIAVLEDAVNTLMEGVTTTNG